MLSDLHWKTIHQLPFVNSTLKIRGNSRLPSDVNNQLYTVVPGINRQRPEEEQSQTRHRFLNYPKILTPGTWSPVTFYIICVNVKILWLCLSLRGFSSFFLHRFLIFKYLPVSTVYYYIYKSKTYLRKSLFQCFSKVIVHVRFENQEKKYPCCHSCHNI